MKNNPKINSRGQPVARLIGNDINAAVASHGNDRVEVAKVDADDRHFDSFGELS